MEVGVVWPRKKVKGSGGKKGASASGTSTPATDSEGPASSSASVNLPYSLLTALLSLSIPPPTSKNDVSIVVSDLETKKAWFEANSERKTKEEIERVEGVVKKLQKKNDAVLGNGANGDAVEDAPEEEAETGGKAEPVHTAVAGLDASEPVTVEKGEQLPSVPESKIVKPWVEKLEAAKSG